MSWIESLDEKLTSLANAEFNYIETSDIQQAANIGTDNSGIYMEATVIYFEIKNIVYILKENGRRKAAQAYTMYSEVLSAVAQQTGGFLNCFSPSAFLIVYPGKDNSIKEAVTGALKMVYALTDKYKHKFSSIIGLEFAMGLDHGHIMGTKTISDNGIETMSWFGTSIYKSMRICKECARPFYIGTSGVVYHNLGEGLKTTTRRILGIKKSVDMWTKVTYQYENVKKHLYQTNHKISLDEE